MGRRAHIGGHNVFVYHYPASRDEPMDVDFGVEASRTFEPPATSLRPRRRRATTLLLRSTSAAAISFHRAHDAIHAWHAREGRRFAGTSREIYGDRSNCPSKIDTTVCYLLEQATGRGPPGILTRSRGTSSVLAALQIRRNSGEALSIYTPSRINQLQKSSRRRATLKVSYMTCTG